MRPSSNKVDGATAAKMIKSTANVNQCTFIVGCIDVSVSNDEFSLLSSQFNEILTKPATEEKVLNILNVYQEED